MEYEAKNFEHLIGMNGLSEKLLRNHFTLYQGYVTNFNKLDQILQGMEKEGKFGTPEFTELNRRLGWEFNGMRLHEYYFGNLTKESQSIDAQSPLLAAIVTEFGSYEMWDKDFKAMSAMRGIGWVILYHDPLAKRLFNVWINEHDAGHFAGATPLVVMDVFEHAYITDYGINRKEYIEKIMTSLDWTVIMQRFSNIIN
jgi:Fe-Mn family superoxide dismutase